MQRLRGRGDAGEFGDGVAQVDSKCGNHDEERGAEAELFADEIGEAFARHHAHARAHFFGDVESDGHGDERPEQRVAELGAGGGVNGDAAGVVVHIRGDQAGADDGEEERDAAAEGAHTTVDFFAADFDARECALECDPGIHFFFVRCRFDASGSREAVAQQATSCKCEARSHQNSLEASRSFG